MAFRMEEILRQTKRLESDYDWFGAAKLYEKALEPEHMEEFSSIEDIHEQMAYALYRFAFQAKTNEEFRERLDRSSKTYEKTIEFYEKRHDSTVKAGIMRCDAMIAYIGYWLALKTDDRKKLINDCWKTTCKALKVFEETGEESEYGKTFNQLSHSADLAFCLEWNSRTREEIMREATRCGEQAVKSLSKSEDQRELATACAKTADYLYALGYSFLSRENQERQFEKARGYWQKARKTCEEAAIIESLSILQGLMLEFGAGAAQTVRFYEKALEYGKKTGDNFVVGYALDMLAYHTGHLAWSLTEDPDELVKLAERGMQYAAEARLQYSKIGFVGPGGYGFLWVEAPYAEYYCMLALKQTDQNKRRDLAKKAFEEGPQLLQRAESSGYPDAVWYSHHVMGKILTLLAKIETEDETKNRLLKEALQHRNEVSRIIERVAPAMYWERGVALVGTGQVKAQLADLTSDSEAKKKMLLESIENEEESFNLLAKGIVSFERQDSMITILGYTKYQCGLLLNHVYEFTHEKEHLTRAAEAFEEAAGYYEKFGLASRVAECHWKTAQIYNTLDERLKAAENFNLAADSYEKSAEKFPQLKDFYTDHATYMQAWSEIEKGRHHHERQEFAQAKEHFSKTAELHKSLKRWSYLEPNYRAWAQIEEAEYLSSKEESQEAVKAFESASRSFSETKKSVQLQLSSIEDDDEKQMATKIIRASGIRKEYCDAKLALEEAKILDKKGDHFGSSKKYGAASEAFEKICETLDSEQEQKEFKPMVTLSRAWQKMMVGEAKASPESFLEASALFEQASRESNSEVTSLLAMGHSRFCNALEAGTRFADTGNVTLQTVATQSLEAAAKYYVKAGFQNACEYAKATSLLFEAYAQMDAAREEKDPEKKAKLCLIAEKVLQTSAGSFMKAEHPEKREQVLRLLEKVREERDLASSIAEVMHAPSIVSTATSFNAMAPTSEEAVGSERFEHADVQANLMVKQKELKIGESLSVQLELVNAGKGSALLTKIKDVIPKGFLLTEKPDTCRAEDSYVNLNGKQLDPLRSEQVKLVLRPTVQGTFTLKPTILYLDEDGKYKSYEPEPMTIVVRELGIKNWLRGER